MMASRLYTHNSFPEHIIFQTLYPANQTPEIVKSLRTRNKTIKYRAKSYTCYESISCGLMKTYHKIIQQREKILKAQPL